MKALLISDIDSDLEALRDMVKGVDCGCGYEIKALSEETRGYTKEKDV